MLNICYFYWRWEMQLLSTYLKNTNIELLINNYIIIQQFLIIWSFA